MQFIIKSISNIVINLKNFKQTANLGHFAIFLVNIATRDDQLCKVVSKIKQLFK